MSALICSSLFIKNQSERKKTGRLHTVFKKENDMLIIKDEISEAGLGFVDKFISNFSLRKKLAKVRSKISAKKSVQLTRMFGVMNSICKNPQVSK